MYCKIKTCNKFTVTVKRFNFFNFLISYYSLFISITYVIVSKHIYTLYFRLYFRLCICLNKDTCNKDGADNENR